MVAATPVPACPRCGYDQSGEIARWNDPAIPPAPRGTCVECGLDFEWIDVLDPERRNLPGFFEHAHGFIDFFASAWRTWSWTVLPWRFWSRVQMHHEVRVMRALAWTLALWLSVWWLNACVMIVLRILNRGWTMNGFAQARAYFESTDLWLFGYPFVAHNPVWANYIASGMNTGVLGWRTWVVNSPVLFQARFGAWECVLASIGFPLMLLVLPHTRADAKLRCAHLLRGTAFGFAWAGAWLVICLLDYSSLLFVKVTQGPTALRSALLSERLFAEWHWFVLAWIAIWWVFAIRTGYRIRRWRIVAVATGIPVALAIVVFRAYVIDILFLTR